MIHDARGEMTTEEVVKLILSVLGILVLFALAYGLYNIFSSGAEEKRAKTHLDNVVTMIDSMKPGMDAEYLFTGIDKWFLVGFERQVILEQGNLAMPEKCGGKSCLCLCKTSIQQSKHPVGGRKPLAERQTFFFKEKGLEMCNKKSVCIVLEEVSVRSRKFPQLKEVETFPWIYMNGSASGIKIWKRESETHKTVLDDINK